MCRFYWHWLATYTVVFQNLCICRLSLHVHEPYGETLGNMSFSNTQRATVTDATVHLRQSLLIKAWQVSHFPQCAFGQNMVATT